MTDQPADTVSYTDADVAPLEPGILDADSTDTARHAPDLRGKRDELQAQLVSMRDEINQANEDHQLAHRQWREAITELGILDSMVAQGAPLEAERFDTQRAWIEECVKVVEEQEAALQAVRDRQRAIRDELAVVNAQIAAVEGAPPPPGTKRVIRSMQTTFSPDRVTGEASTSRPSAAAAVDTEGGN